MIVRHLGGQTAATAILTISAAMLPGPRVAAGLSFDAPQDAAPPVAQLTAMPLYDSGEHPSATVSRTVSIHGERIVVADTESEHAEMGLSTRGIEFHERNYRHNEVAPPIDR